MKFLQFLLLVSLLLAGCSANTSSTAKIHTSKPRTYEMDARHVTYLKGVEQEKKQNYTEAVKYYKEAAQQGHYMARNDLGVKYFKGLGVKQDYKKALHWFNKVVDQAPDPTTNYNLGQMYRQGFGVKKDLPRAIEMYRIAERMGSTDAQYNLGAMYLNGQGVAQNRKIARDYFQKASNKGHSLAQNNLGVMYRKEGNIQQAKYWYQKAAKQGNKLAAQNLSKISKR